MKQRKQGTCFLECLPTASESSHLLFNPVLNWVLLAVNWVSRHSWCSLNNQKKLSSVPEQPSHTRCIRETNTHWLLILVLCKASFVCSGNYCGFAARLELVVASSSTVGNQIDHAGGSSQKCHCHQVLIHSPWVIFWLPVCIQTYLIFSLLSEVLHNWSDICFLMISSAVRSRDAWHLCLHHKQRWGRALKHIGSTQFCRSEKPWQTWS